MTSRELLDTDCIVFFFLFLFQLGLNILSHLFFIPSFQYDFNHN